MAELSNRNDNNNISSGCSSGGPGLDSQHPHGRSQLSVTPIPEILACLSGHCEHQVLRWHKDIYADKSLIHTEKIKVKTLSEFL